MLYKIEKDIWICDRCKNKINEIDKAIFINKSRKLILCNRCIVELYWEWHDKEFHKLQKICPKGEISFKEELFIIRCGISDKLREKIFKRDNCKCVKCSSTEELVIDHIIPFIKGGRTIEDNLQTLCRKCNSKKGDKIEI